MAQSALRAIPQITDVSQKRETIQKLDLGRVMDRVQSEHGWDDARREQAEAQYRAFLTVAYANPGTRLVPTNDIDEVWHNHILHTRDYVQMCDDVFGGYLHHNPHKESEIDKVAHQAAFEISKDLLAAELIEVTGKKQASIFRSAAICDGGAYCDGDIRAAICDGGAYCD